MSALAALICHRSTQTGPITAEFTYWATAAEARHAEAELTPCGPLCIGAHSVARLDLLPDSRRAAGHVLRPSREAVR